MQIKPLNNTVQLVRLNQTDSVRHNTTESYRVTQSRQNPSFRGGNIYQKIIKDPNLAKDFIGMMTLAVGALFAAANAGNEQTADAQNIAEQTCDNDIFSMIVRNLQQAVKKEPENPNAYEDKIAELEKRNSELEKEIIQLKERDITPISDDRTEFETPEEAYSSEAEEVINEPTMQQNMDEAMPISDDEIRVIGSDNKFCSQKEKEENTAKAEELQPVIFPKKHGRLSKVQSRLKDVSAKIVLPADVNIKFTEICTILMSKEYTTKSGKSINCEELASLLADRLEANIDNALPVINTCYKRLELEDYEAPDGKSGTPDEASSDANTAKEYARVEEALNIKYAPTSYQEVLDNPIPPLKVIGTIDLTGMDMRKRIRQTPADNEIDSDTLAKTKTSDEESNLQTGSKHKRFARFVREPLSYEAGNIASSENIPNPIENFYTRLDTTPDDPRVSFPYFASGEVMSNLFAAPEKIVYDSLFGRGSTYRFKKETAGEMAKILLAFEKYYNNTKENDLRRDNIRIWANNILFPPENPDAEINLDSLRTVSIRVNTDKNTAENITKDDILQEINLKDDDYPNIKSAIMQSNNSEKKLCYTKNYQILDEIVDAINDDKRFSDFSIHGAMRLIERLVDFSCDIPVQDQCSQLYVLIECALKQGVQVKTYMTTNSKVDKFGNIIIKIAPNIIIPSELYTAEDKKLFRNDDLMISLCEHQPNGDYNKLLKKPLIKTLVIHNTW